MKPGDFCEIAIWLNGTESPEQIERFKTEAARNAFNQAEQLHHVEIGVIECTIKRPGEERVPQVPNHISGPDVRLLVCTGKVVAMRPQPSAVISGHHGFVDDLTYEDLTRLRRLTRMIRRRSEPGVTLNNKQCDAIINAMGPEAALKTLGKATN